MPWPTPHSKTPAKNLRPLLRQVATAFPAARGELWATASPDEHRIGHKPRHAPRLGPDWPTPGHPGAPPLCLALPRRLRPPRQWAHRLPPGSWATSVSLARFEGELARFAAAVGASPPKQIVLVLDRAGWASGHTSARLRVLAHVHLLLLPAYSPELQPAEHLWPLTNAALVNRRFADIEGREDAQVAGCAALQRQPDRIRSTTCFHWWPKQIHKPLGPRRR
jgi:transposase